MKNKELFDLTIGILVKAYLGNNLDQMDCAACAVGNLVSANLGYKWVENNEWEDKEGKLIIPSWDFGRLLSSRKLCPKRLSAQGRKEIRSTGYTASQLLYIEVAFMDTEDENDNYTGLMNVVDTLMLIHEANETEVKQAKELFVLS